MSTPVRRVPMTRRRAAEITRELSGGSTPTTFDPHANFRQNDSDYTGGLSFVQQQLPAARGGGGGDDVGDNNSSLSAQNAFEIEQSSAQQESPLKNASGFSTTHHKSRRYAAGLLSGQGGTAAAPAPSASGSTTSSRSFGFRCVGACSRPPPSLGASGMYGLDTVQCRKCRHFLHASCVGLTRPETLTSKLEQKAAQISMDTFVCPQCVVVTPRGNNATGTTTSKKKTTATAATAAAAAAAAPEPFISETPDAPPANPEPFNRALKHATDFLKQSGFRLVLFPPKTLTDAMLADIRACAASSVQSATFSDEYPVWCAREIQAQRHPSYLQGAAAQCVASSRIVAVVFSNGRDPYCDLKRTVQHLKAQITRGSVLLSEPSSSSSSSSSSSDDSDSDEDSSNQRRRQRSKNDGKSAANNVKAPKNTASKSKSKSEQQAEDEDSSYVIPGSSTLVLRGKQLETATRVLSFKAFDAAVHFTFVVTLDEFRGRRLASTLMWVELARWALRGRHNACVNMALEKVYGEEEDDDEGSDAGSVVAVVSDEEDNSNAIAPSSAKLQCRISESSYRLYANLKFAEVFPRYHADGSLRWTKKEEAAGRMMISFDFPKCFENGTCPFQNKVAVKK